MCVRVCVLIELQSCVCVCWDVYLNSYAFSIFIKVLYFPRVSGNYLLLKLFIRLNIVLEKNVKKSEMINLISCVCCVFDECLWSVVAL